MADGGELRVGFVGLGHISHENVLGYLGDSGARIVAVCSPSPQRAQAWLTKYGLTEARYYSDHREMIDREQLDIIEILTPHDLHYRHAVDAAEGGVRGISLQKPMAVSLRQCQAIIDAAHRHGAVLKVYENFVFYPVYLKARDLIRAGRIGEPISIRVHTLGGKRDGTGWPWPFVPSSWRVDVAAAGTGPLVGDDGFHKFSLARWIMERDLETVGAWIDPETPLDAPAFIRGRFHRRGDEPRRYAQFDFSFSPRMDTPFDFWLDDFVEIVGERGTMWINQCSAAGDRPLFAGNHMSDSPVFPPIAVYTDGNVETYLTEITPSERNWSTSFVGSTRDFIKVMREGGTPLYTGEDGMEITRYAIAATVSAELGRDVALDEITVEAEERGTFAITTNFLNLPTEG